MDFSGFPQFFPQPAAAPAPAVAPAPAPTTAPLPASDSALVNRLGSDNAGGLIGGLASGFTGLSTGLLGTGAALAHSVGAQGLSDALEQGSARGAALQTALGGKVAQQGWTENGIGGALNKALYTAGNVTPTLLGAVGLAPELAGAAALGEGSVAARALSAIVPKALGGVAPEGVAALTALNAPQQIAENYNKASQQPGGASWLDAVRSVLQGTATGVASSIVPGEEVAAAAAGKGAFEGTVLQRVGKAAITNAAAGAIGSGVTQASTDSFDPTLTAGDRMSNIVNAAVEGGISGGVIGGLAGFLPHKPGAPPPANDEITAALDQAGITPSNKQLPPPPTPPAPGAPIDAEFRDVTPQPPGSLPAPTQGALAAPPAGLPTPEAPGAAGATTTPAEPAGGPAAPSAPPVDGTTPAALGGAPKLAPDAVETPAAQPPIQTALSDAGIKLPQAGPFRKFVDASTAGSVEDLHGEIMQALEDRAPVADTTKFMTLAKSLGLLDKTGEPTELGRAAIPHPADLLETPQPTTEPVPTAPQADPLRQVAPVEAPADVGAALNAAPEPDLLKTMSDKIAEATGGDEPKPIVERVMDAAHDLTGGTGGAAKVADILAHGDLKDVAPADIKSALQQIHDDDSGNALAGRGATRRLVLEPREDTDAVQEPSAAKEDVGDQSAGGAADGGRDTPDSSAAGTGDAQKEGSTQGQSGTFDVLQTVSKSRERKQIEAAYKGATGNRDAVAVPLDNIRDRLGSMQRKDVDKGLAEILKDPQGFSLMRHDDPKQITPSMSKAAFNPSGEPFHVLFRGADAAKFKEPAAASQADAPPPITRSPPGTSEAGKALRGKAPGARRVDQPTVDARGQTNDAFRRAQDEAAAAIQEARNSIGGTQDDIAKSVLEEPPAPSDPITPKVATGDATGEQPNTTPEIRQHFSDLMSKFTPEVQRRVHLVNSADELPKAFRDQAMKQYGGLDAIPAAMHRGEVYIRADQMRNKADLEEMISHEVVGHMGNRVRTGVDGGNNGTFVDTFSNIFDKMGGVEGFKNIAKQYNLFERETGPGSLGDYLKGLGIDDINNMKPYQKALLVDELVSQAAEGSRMGAVQRGLLAFDGVVKQAIAKLLRAAGLNDFAARFEKFTPADLEKWLADSREMLTGDPGQGAPRVDLSSLVGDRASNLFSDNLQAKIRTPQDAMSVASDLQRVVEGLGERMNAIGLKRKIGNTVVKLVYGGRDMVREFGDKVPGMTEHYRTSEQEKVAIKANLARVKSEAFQMERELRQSSPIAAAMVQELQRLTGGYALNPDTKFADHTWHLDKPSDQVRQLKEAHDRVLAIKNALNQGVGGSKAGEGMAVFRATVRNNETDNYAKMALNLHIMRADKFSKDAVERMDYEPAQKFALMDEAHTGDAAHAYWKAAYENAQSAMSELSNTLADDMTRADSLNHMLLKQELGKNAVSVAQQAQAPYAHFGRIGDFFVSTHFKQGADGRPDPVALAAAQKLMSDNGFKNITLDPLSDKSRFFARVETEQQMFKLRELFNSPEMKPHLDPELSDDPRAEKVTRAGSLETDPTLLKDLPTSSIVDQLEAAYGDDPAKANVIDEIRSAILNAQPDNRIGNVYETRENVLGYDSDMARNARFRSELTDNAITAMATAQKQAKYVGQMRQSVKDAQVKNGGAEALAQKDRVDAYLQRDAASRVAPSNSFWRGAQTFAHSYFLIASPAFVALQVSQLPTLTVPELMKHHSLVRTSAGMGVGLAKMGKVMMALAKAGTLDIQAHHLEAAGLSKGDVDYVMGLANRAKLEIGTYAQAMKGKFNARGPIGDHVAGMLHFGNQFATAAEIIARLTTAFATKHVYDTAHPNVQARINSQYGGLMGYASHVLTESMLNWGSYDTPKLFTAGGPLGSMGPAVFQFHQFQTKLFAKIFNEAQGMYQNRGSTPEESARLKTEARRYAAAHGAAVTLMAGALGLPAAGWAAAALTQASGVFNDGEGYDVTAHLREFLAATIGPGAGEILTRGLPRYLGVDLSDLGDKVLPLQTLLENHADFRDAITDQLAQSWGSGAGAVTNIGSGMLEALHGRYLQALTKALPTGLRNVAKAYELGTRGYINEKTGLAMPIKASAADVIKQLLGFKSGNLAEMQEKTQDKFNADADRKAHAAVIEQNLMRAIVEQDKSGTQSGMRAMAAYDRDPTHAMQALSPGFAGKLTSAEIQAKQAQALGVPGGTALTKLPTYPIHF